MTTMTSTAPPIAAIMPTLRAGLRWLYETEQPDGALLQHHGESIRPTPGRSYNFCPQGWNGFPVVSVSLVGGYQAPPNSLATGELEELADVLDCLSGGVESSWNGHPAITGSVALSRLAHPSLLAAVALYHAGCPEHPHLRVFCQCGWYHAGYQHVIRPSLNEEESR